MADKKLKIGLLREGKTPPDARVPLAPSQCAALQRQFPLTIVAQPSPHRAFTDAEYREQGIALQEDLSDCDVLLGVKEVSADALIPEKTYLFFSHTIKKQPYNRAMLQTILERRIRLIDYEVITTDEGARLVAFGYFAGLVGAHNALWAYGRRSGAFELPRLHQLRQYSEAKAAYETVNWPPVRIVLTGSGRVAQGAIRCLHDMGIRQASPVDFLKKQFDAPVFTQLHAQEYARHSDRLRIFNKAHFYAHGDEYTSAFAPYAAAADIFINAIYYDPKAPAFFTPEEMAQADFRIRVIADITCDIAPESSVPSTLRACSIADPVFGYDPVTRKETAPFGANVIDMMTVDNLPSELPRDASDYFGRQLTDHVIPEFFKENSPRLERACIAQGGALTPLYAYLSDYVYAVES